MWLLFSGTWDHLGIICNWTVLQNGDLLQSVNGGWCVLFCCCCCCCLILRRWLFYDQNEKPLPKLWLSLLHVKYFFSILKINIHADDNFLLLSFKDKKDCSFVNVWNTDSTVLMCVCQRQADINNDPGDLTDDVIALANPAVSMNLSETVSRRSNSLLYWKDV